MRKNLLNRIFCIALSVVLLFGLLPTGILGDLVGDWAKNLGADLSTEAEAVKGTNYRIGGLFYVRMKNSTSMYMTNTDDLNGCAYFSAKKSGDNAYFQMWLFIVGDDQLTYFRSLSDVNAAKSSKGDHWFCWDTTRVGHNWPSSYPISGNTSDPGNPKNNNGYKWETTSITANDDGSYYCYIKEHGLNYYIQNYNNNVITGRQVGNTSGTELWLVPVEDPDFSHANPIQFNNQPQGTTSYRLRNDSGTTVTMGAESENVKGITWAATPANNGYYFLINRQTGNYLTADMVNVGGRTTTKAITSTNPHNDASVQWQVVRQRYAQSNGTWFTTYIIFNKGTGLVLISNGSTVSTGYYPFAANMGTYWTMGYNSTHGTQIPETLKFYSWTSGDAKYWPAAFSSKAGYVALRLNKAYYTEDSGGGYLFDTAAITKADGTSALGYDSSSGLVYNSSYAGASSSPPSSGLGTTTVYFSFTKASNSFLYLIGHGTEVTVSIGGSQTKVTNGIMKASIGSSNSVVSITASGHFGVFTNIMPADNVTTDNTITISAGTDNQVLHSTNSTYTVKVKNNKSYAIDNVCFSVTIKKGSSTIATLTCSNGTGSTTDKAKATLDSGSRRIEAGKSADYKITIIATGMSAGDTYTITVNQGSCLSFKTTASVGSYDIKTTATGGATSKTVSKCNGGSVTAKITADPSTNGVSNGSVVYTIKLTNTCNHSVSSLYFTFGDSNATPLKVENGTYTLTNASVDKQPTSIGANTSVEIKVTVNINKLAGSKDYKFALTGGKASNGCSLTFSHGSVSTVTPSTGDVTITVSPGTAGDIVVKGNYVYTITIKNTTNHTVKVTQFSLNAGSKALFSVDSNGNIIVPDGVTFAFTSSHKDVTGIPKNTTVTISVTVNTSNTSLLAAGKDYEVKSGTFTATATDLISGTREISKAGASVQTITTANGGVTLSLTTNLNNNGVGESEVVYTIELKNGANHGLKNIVITLKDASGNPLMTITKDGIKYNSTLVSGAIVTGDLSSLAKGGTITISNIKINAADASLDATGRLTVQAFVTAPSSGVYGTAGDSANYTLSDESGTHTFMVRHNVNLLVQSGVQATIPANALLAAMNKTTAYGPETSKGLVKDSISKLVTTNVQGTETAISGITVSGTNLIVKLSANCNTAIVEVTYPGGTILVPFQVNVLSAGDAKTYVLNYSLPVTAPFSEITTDVATGSGAYSNLSLAAQGIAKAELGALESPLTGAYGNFELTNNAVKYTNTKIMNGGDTAYLVVRAGNAQDGTAYVDYVDLYKQITMIPANSIYYEDDNADIDYGEINGIETLGALNGSSTTITLPLTPGKNTFNDGSFTSAAVEYSGLGCKKVPVTNEQVTVRFTFTGTGFELLSRVNGVDSATLLIKVSPANQNQWTWYPVITRFQPNGVNSAEVYQVPVFRLNEVAYGAYDVQVVGLPMTEYDENGNPSGEFTPNYIYIDGIRVYNPLNDDKLTENYGDEQGAGFENLRDMILGGNGMLTNTDESGKTSNFTTGDFYFTPDDEGHFVAVNGGINELGAIGANNEILLRQNNHMIVLRVKGTGLLQIGIHDVHDDKFDGGNGSNLSSTVEIFSTSGWTVLANAFTHGTERYYSIETSKCPVDSDGYALVMLRVASGFASFTNVKYKNVTFGAIGNVADKLYTEPGYFISKNGDLCTFDENGTLKIVESGYLANLAEIDNLLQEQTV